VTPTLQELSEDTAVHLLQRPGFELIDRGDFAYEAAAHRGAVHRIRLGDVAAALEWTRAESHRRGHTTVEWWVGWSATPADLGERLLESGLVPDDPPALTGMTCAVEPPTAPEIEIRPITTLEEQLAALEVDWEVWGLSPADRVQRAAWERERFEPILAGGTVHHFVALVAGRRVGFGRAIDMDGAVGLMGGAVLPEARGRGVYRALVRARWEHAAARRTPLLVVQAGPMSEPVLTGLGFESHGELRLYVDRL
jgi:GNAT superfamily N-acetyltransferase